MGAAFGNKDAVTIAQILQGSYALDSRCQKALMTGHENRKGRERHALRRVGRYAFKGLAVRDDHFRRPAQLLQCLLKTRLLNDNGCAIGIKDIPDGLLLRQDEPSLRSCRIDRHDEDKEIARLYHISYDRRRLGVRLQTGQAFLELSYARAVQGTDVQP